MEFTDAAAIGGTRITRDGYLVTEANVGRTGIQMYRGAELGRPDMQVVRVYRPEDEVFHEDAMRSAAFRPITNDHPSKMVDATTWKRVAVGQTGDSVARDGARLKVPLVLMDAGAIADVQNGKRELSLGYRATIDWTAGETPDGEKFDAVQRNISINHLAVVDLARAGPTCRIGDSWSTPTLEHERIDPDMPDNLRTVLVDGISIQVTDQGVQAIEKLQKQIADATAAHSATVATKDADLTALRDSTAKAIASKDGEIVALTAANTKAIEAKDGEMAGLAGKHKSELEAKDGEIAGLKAQIPDAAALDALIVRRTAVIDAARKVLGDSFDPKGKTEAEIRRASVAKRLGDAAVADRSDDYVAACFDTLTAVGNTTTSRGRDPVADALRNGKGRTDATDTGGVSAAHAEYVKSLADGWQQPADSHPLARGEK